MSLISQQHLQDEAAAHAWVESHVWPDGPVCPKCGAKNRASKMQGKATRIGLWKCYACRKQFTVKVGTIFESTHVPLHLWLQAFYLLAGSKKGISSNQLHRTLGVTLKTAWFMSHRIREAMRTGTLSPPLGGDASLKIAASCSVLLHVLAAFQLCWAARPLEPERARSQIMALFTSESLVNDTFKHYRRGWRFTLVALAVSSATLALFVLSAAGIDTADMLAQLARWPRR